MLFFVLLKTGWRYSQHGLFPLGVLTLWAVYSVVESLSPFAEGDIVLVVLVIGALQGAMSQDTPGLERYH